MALIKQTVTQVKAEINKKGFWEGYICPSKCYPAPNHPFNVSIRVRMLTIKELEETINNYAYYNCNYELGYKVHYYKAMN